MNIKIGNLVTLKNQPENLADNTYQVLAYNTKSGSVHLRIFQGTFTENCSFRKTVTIDDIDTNCDANLEIFTEEECAEQLTFC